MRILLLAFLGFCLSGLSIAGAQEYPTRTITIIVPYAPGGADYQIRALQPLLSQGLGQTIVVENRGGGGAAIGTAAVKRAEPDGYTLLFTGTAAISVVPNLRETPYRLEDFAPVGNISATPLIVAARSDLPYKTLAELIAYAKANPEKVLMGSAGHGTTTHIVGEALQNEANVRFTHVPFTGMGAALTAMLSGSIDIFIGLPAPLMPHLTAGKFRALASTGSKRSEFVPDVPTLSEAGYDVVEETRFGLFAPKGTPARIVDKLNAQLARHVSSKEFSDLMTKSFTSVSYLGPDDLGKAVRNEDAYWKRLVSTSDILKRISTP